MRLKRAGGLIIYGLTIAIGFLVIWFQWTSSPGALAVILFGGSLLSSVLLLGKKFGQSWFSLASFLTLTVLSAAVLTVVGWVVLIMIGSLVSGLTHIGTGI